MDGLLVGCGVGCSYIVTNSSVFSWFQDWTWDFFIGGGLKETFLSRCTSCQAMTIPSPPTCCLGKATWHGKSPEMERHDSHYQMFCWSRCIYGKLTDTLGTWGPLLWNPKRSPCMEGRRGTEVLVVESEKAHQSPNQQDKVFNSWLAAPLHDLMRRFHAASPPSRSDNRHDLCTSFFFRRSGSGWLSHQAKS